MSGEANIRLEGLEVDDVVRDIAHEQRVRGDLVAELERRDRERRDRRIDLALQICITLLTLSALWLITSASPYARWGHVVGLVSQPFYMLATWRARQWGMFIVAVMTCGIWLRGIVNHFL